MWGARADEFKNVDGIMKIRALLVKDSAPDRANLRSLLSEAEEIEVAGEAESGREAVKQVKSLKPDLVVMEVALAYSNGIEATRQMVQAAPASRALLLSRPVLPDQIAEAIHAGARGYLFEVDVRGELLRAARDVHAGRTYLGQGVIALFLGRGTEKRQPPDAEAVARLTNREREILPLIAMGLSSNEIAYRLHISSHTVDTHRRHIMHRLDIHNLAGLIRFSIRNGLISLD